jgi:hypothetical protein
MRAAEEAGGRLRKTTLKMAPLYVALMHHPVLNRKGETIASAVTNLDLHDLARAARTYEIPASFVVTPLKDQQMLVTRLIGHWCEGVGREIHPDRMNTNVCGWWTAWLAPKRSEARRPPRNEPPDPGTASHDSWPGTGNPGGSVSDSPSSGYRMGLGPTVLSEVTGARKSVAERIQPFVRPVRPRF